MIEHFPDQKMPVVKPTLDNRGQKNSPLLGFGREVVANTLQFFSRRLSRRKGSGIVIVCLGVRDARRRLVVNKNVGALNAVANLDSKANGVNVLVKHVKSMHENIVVLKMEVIVQLVILTNYVKMNVSGVAHFTICSLRMLNHYGLAESINGLLHFVENATTNLIPCLGTFGKQAYGR